MAAEAVERANARREAVERQLSEALGGQADASRREEMRQAQERQERIATVQAKAMRRLGSSAILRGWTAWEAAWQEASRHRRVVAAAAAKLSRPLVVAVFATWRTEWEAEQERTAEARQKAHREATARAMRARAASAARSSATAEGEFRMRGEWHIAVAQRREAARQQRRAAMRRERAEAGREDNILYLNTHGDRLHWDPPRFEHTLEDGDGRWPYPMSVPVEPLRGGPPGARTFQYV